jgi:hypothetical protein
MAVGVGRRPTGQAVAVACVDYDELRGTAQHRDARLGIAHRAAEGEPHRAEAEPVDLQVTAQKELAASVRGRVHGPGPVRCCG